MHLSEGILPLKWAGLWSLVAVPFVAKGIADVKKKAKETPQIKPLLGLMAAAVFILSCMPIPVPTAGSCSHPCGTGIAAILVGPFLSVLITSVALFIQALLMCHGGFTTWGADIVSMGVAGSFTGYIIFKILRKFNAPLFLSGFAAGLLADWATYAVTSFELASALHGNASLAKLFMTIIIAFIPTQLPLGILEGFITGGMIVFVAKRRPDILASFGIVEKLKIKNQKSKLNIKNQNILLCFIVLMFGLFVYSVPLFAADKWSGVDETVVEKVAEEHGRKAWTPFINTDKGDLLLFVFLLAGAVGGFALGFYWRKLFRESDKTQRNIRND